MLASGWWFDARNAGVDALDDGVAKAEGSHQPSGDAVGGFGSIT